MPCIRSRVTQRLDLCVIPDQYMGTIAVMNDEYLDWGHEQAHQRLWAHHLVSNFHSRFHDKSLKMLLVRATYERQPHKFDYRME